MLEFLTLGIIPSRYHKNSLVVNEDKQRRARNYKSMGHSDRTIAIKMKVDYHKVPQLLATEERY